MNLPFTIGIGLLGALLQALSYFGTRSFLASPRIGRDSFQLLGVSHAIMAFISLFLLSIPNLFASVPWGAYTTWLLPVLGATLFYLIAQFFLFRALRLAEASRVSPMLGLKIVFLALLSSLVLGQHLSVTKWMAVILCGIAATALQRSGGGLPFKALVYTIAASLAYTGSDLSIPRLVDAIPAMSGRWTPSFTAAALSYTFSGFIALALLPRVFRLYPVSATPCNKQPILVRKTWRDWAHDCKDAIPFSLCWFGGMFCLFYCMGSGGVILAVILQSFRGPISVVLGKITHALGFIKMESSKETGMLLKHFAAALLMALALILYARGGIH